MEIVVDPSWAVFPLEVLLSSLRTYVALFLSFVRHGGYLEVVMVPFFFCFSWLTFVVATPSNWLKRLTRTPGRRKTTHSPPVRRAWQLGDPYQTLSAEYHLG